MDIRDLNTVAKIAIFVKETVQLYRLDVDKKVKVITELAPLFTSDSDGWKLIVDRGKFRNGFTRVLGKGGMRALKDILFDIDERKYQKMDFGIES